MLEETLRLFVEAIGKDEASMRQQLVSKRSAELLRDREFWRTRVEEKKLAAQSEKKTAAVCDQPPGLDELAWHIEAPSMGAGGSHPQATTMPDPCATYTCPPQAKPKSAIFSQQARIFPVILEGFVVDKKRSDTRAQEAASLIDEPLNFFVKTTGKDEASMRQQLTGQKREELLRNRDHWKARAEDEDRF